MRPDPVRIDSLAQWFYEGLTLKPPDEKAMGVPKPLETKEEYLIVQILATENMHAEEGGVAQMAAAGERETWYQTVVSLNLTIIEPHHFDGYNTYALAATAIEDIKREVRALPLQERDPDVIDWWFNGHSAPDLGDGQGKQQVMELSLSFTVQWREIWQRIGQ